MECFVLFSLVNAPKLLQNSSLSLVSPPQTGLQYTVTFHSLFAGCPVQEAEWTLCFYLVDKLPKRKWFHERCCHNGDQRVIWSYVCMLLCLCIYRCTHMGVYICKAYVCVQYVQFNNEKEYNGIAYDYINHLMNLSFGNHNVCKYVLYVCNIYLIILYNINNQYICIVPVFCFCWVVRRWSNNNSDWMCML